jgi:glutamate synthase (NADPH/NADH) small chain
MLPKVTREQVIYNPLYQKPKEAKFDSSQEEYQNKFLKDPHIYQATVKAVQADAQGNIQSVTLVRLAAGYDEARRLVIAAGFLGPKAETAKAFGVETDGRSNILGFQTNVPKVFACGDCHTGQSLVVKAMVEGRECAKAVDAFLKD